MFVLMVIRIEFVTVEALSKKTISALSGTTCLLLFRHEQGLSPPRTSYRAHAGLQVCLARLLTGSRQKLSETTCLLRPRSPEYSRFPRTHPPCTSSQARTGLRETPSPPPRGTTSLPPYYSWVLLRDL